MSFKTVNGKRGFATSQKVVAMNGKIKCDSFKTVNGKRGFATILNGGVEKISAEKCFKTVNGKRGFATNL